MTEIDTTIQSNQHMEDEIEKDIYTTAEEYPYEEDTVSPKNGEACYCKIPDDEVTESVAEDDIQNEIEEIDDETLDLADIDESGEHINEGSEGEADKSITRKDDGDDDDESSDHDKEDGTSEEEVPDTEDNDVDSKDEGTVDDLVNVDNADLAEELQKATLEEEDDAPHAEFSLSEEPTSSSKSKVKSKKLNWVPKPSIPAYMLNATKKLNIDELGKTIITTKGQAEKLAAAKKEKMAEKLREMKKQHKEESEKLKKETALRRQQAVAAEKARVLAAKKAREDQAERIRLEAIQRRKNENQEKTRQHEDFELRKNTINKVRQQIIQQQKEGDTSPVSHA
ncbi:hypothetical protein BgAZ_306030 [Babesia gibsoni]|uniref:Uncharacterized protein n=1 Tax=Babesia gibsoni TaxID=33632 RepID=A0AAD8P923_BABGI|nr:hypothetical protein BgAZ_306030 [Babesia gibsoni]